MSLIKRRKVLRKQTQRAEKHSTLVWGPGKIKGHAVVVGASPKKGTKTKTTNKFLKSYAKKSKKFHRMAKRAGYGGGYDPFGSTRTQRKKQHKRYRDAGHKIRPVGHPLY